jgi:hypothetical protein
VITSATSHAPRRLDGESIREYVERTGRGSRGQFVVDATGSGATTAPASGVALQVDQSAKAAPLAVGDRVEWANTKQCNWHGTVVELIDAGTVKVRWDLGAHGYPLIELINNLCRVPPAHSQVEWEDMTAFDERIRRLERWMHGVKSRL